MTPPRRRARGLGAAAATAVVASATLAAPALAAPSGSTTIDLKGPAAKALSSQQVKLSAKKPAKASAKKIVLTVRRATVGAKAAKLTHGGAVTLRRKAGGRTRAVTLTAWQTQVAAKRTTISAKLGGKRVALFTATAPKRRVTLNASGGAATVAGATVRLTPAGAKALRAKLALRRLPAAQIGSGKVAARTGATGEPTTPTPGGPTTGPATPTPTPAQCSGYTVGNVPEAAAPLARTDGAVNAQSVSMEWYARDSWIRYINGGFAAGDGVNPSDGATLLPAAPFPIATETQPVPSRSPRLQYGVVFTPALGDGTWYDPTTHQGVLRFTGTIKYVWADHGIDLTFRDPEVELNGASSRVVITVTGSACSRLPAKRVDIQALTLPSAPVANPYAYAIAPARVTAPADNLFTGAYGAGREWGLLKDLTITLP